MSVIVQAVEEGFVIGSLTGPFIAYTSKLPSPTGGTFLSTEELYALRDAMKEGKFDDFEPLPVPPADESYVAPERFIEL